MLLFLNSSHIFYSFMACFKQLSFIHLINIYQIDFYLINPKEVSTFAQLHVFMVDIHIFSPPKSSFIITSLLYLLNYSKILKCFLVNQLFFHLLLIIFYLTIATVIENFQQVCFALLKVHNTNPTKRSQNYQIIFKNQRLEQILSCNFDFIMKKYQFLYLLLYFIVHINLVSIISYIGLLILSVN